MLDDPQRSSLPQDLFAIIAHVRTRWRTKLALSGAVRLLAVAFGLFVLAAYGMETVRFTTTSIVVARIGLVLGLIAAALWFVVRPLRRKVTDEQVALYLEEHEPSLQATLLSAVESSRNGGIAAESAALVQKVVEQAIEAVSRMDAARRADQAPLKRWALGLGGVAAAAVLVVMVGPAFLRNAASALLLVSRSIEAAVPYRLDVQPGSKEVPKGADQAVKVKLFGFNSDKVVLRAQRNTASATPNWEEVPLVRNEDGTWDGMLFDVLAPLKYEVEADGVKSKEFLLTVVDVPYVKKLDLEYHYPSYTGLEVEKIEDGGDIAVLRGTEVRVHITPTMKTPGGQIKVNDKQTVPLTLQQDGTLTGAFKADADGNYRVELQTPAKENVAASPQYTIDTLADRAPTVSFKKPGRDTSVSPIEELVVEANAEDDYGIRDLELVYSVNGGAEKVVKLFKGDRRVPEFIGGHTFYLEELNVQPGDAVSYYARAMDNDAVGGSKQATSDLYFLRVRPFKKDFRQAPSQGGGGGGGGGGGQQNQVEALSEQQKQIISATFNVNREKKTLTPQKLKENSKIVELAQQKLREQVQGLLTRMNSELVERDPAFAKIAEMLPQAVTAMKEAEGQLAAAKPDVAITPENKALQVLQKAEEEYETQISVQRAQQGGGGGGGGGAMQRELEELFEQDLDQLASRFESAPQASSEQQADRQVDEALEKLKELARRQEQQAESQARRRALEGGGGGGGASAAEQRALAEKLEEVARRLERLSREAQRPEVAEAARAAQDAANALRRAAAGDSRAQAEAAAATEKLRQAQRALERSQTQRTQQNIEDAKRRAEQLARDQREIADMARKLPQGAGRPQAAGQIAERKAQLSERVGQLEADLDRAARGVSTDERAAGRKLAEAAGEIRDNQIQEQIRLSSRMVSQGSNPSTIDRAESEITEGLDAVRARLDEAERALGAGQQRNAAEDRANRARDAARRAESLQERTRERAQQGQGQQGQGQQGQGQQGQGQQGQGQQARGQQGQGQQGQGQQGQGQQGQGGQGQGQGGQQAQNGQNGGDGRNNNGGFRNGGTDRGGGSYNGLGWGGWYLGEEDQRQLRGEARQLDAEARALLSRVNGENLTPREQEELLEALRRLQDERTYKDVGELVRLQAIVAEGLKRFEFGLRRKVEGEQDAIALSGADESPEAYKKANEQYFRSLSKGGK
jgi:hypothetical protein